MAEGKHSSVSHTSRGQRSRGAKRMLLECPVIISLVKCDLSKVLLWILPLVVTAFSQVFPELRPGKFVYCSVLSFFTLESALTIGKMQTLVEGCVSLAL